MKDEIVPRNRTARAAAATTGNPPNTRLESSVANCFPGLEFDIRTLDRRFFPGLLFEFIPRPLNAPPNWRGLIQGARLTYVDYLQDPMLPEKATEQWVHDLRAALGSAIGNSLASGAWYIHWVEQKGVRVTMYDEKGAPLDGTVVWRLVRGLETKEPVTICLASRDADGNIDQPLITLLGYRRVYVPESGVFDASYRPGEFTESMCNPWTHDFRDCACHYWAASRPDVVFGPAAPHQGAHASPSSVRREETRFDWLRDVRGTSGDATASGTLGENRPFQVDHYEINHDWEKLSFVLEGREIDADYEAPPDAFPEPYASPGEMVADLEDRLAPMEMSLALEYLYALFSLHSPDEASTKQWPTLSGDLVYLRRGLLMIAASEMTHLRWANQLLWELHRALPLATPYRPILFPKRNNRPSELRRLEPSTLDHFIRVERPGGPIDTAYAKCVATLRPEAYPANLCALAVRIDSDGMEHHLRFLEMKAALESYPAQPPFPYLRDVKIGSPQQTKEAMAVFGDIRDNLRLAFIEEAAGKLDRAQVFSAKARTLMTTLRVEAEKLAARGVGIPFFDVSSPKR